MLAVKFFQRRRDSIALEELELELSKQVMVFLFLFLFLFWSHAATIGVIHKIVICDHIKGGGDKAANTTPTNMGFRK